MLVEVAEETYCAFLDARLVGRRSAAPFRENFAASRRRARRPAPSVCHIARGMIPRVSSWICHAASTCCKSLLLQFIGMDGIQFQDLLFLHVGCVDVMSAVDVSF